jgi:hypothetical protein
LEKFGAEGVHTNLLSDREFRANRPNECHTYGRAYNSISTFSFTALFALNSVLTDLHLTLLNFCVFHENRRREYRTSLTGVNENTFMPTP